MMTLQIENELRSLDDLSFNLITDPYIQELLFEVEEGESRYEQYVMAEQLRVRMLDLGDYRQYSPYIYVYDRFGTEYSVGMNPISLTPLEYSIVAAKAEQAGGSSVWLPLLNDHDGITLARQIRSYRHLSLSPLGTLAMHVNLDQMVQEAKLILGSQETNFYIRGQNTLYSDVSQELEHEIEEALLATKGYAIVKREEEKYFVTKYTSKDFGWHYYILTSYDSIFERIQQVKNLVFFLFVLLFLLMLSILHWFSNKMTNPIEQLLSQMKHLQQGSFKGDVHIYPNDEIGQLHKEFQVMGMKIKTLLADNYSKQLSIKESQYKALQAQINPHFMNNTLQAINWSAKLSGQKQISSMVESLGFLLRNAMQMDEALVSLRDEMETVSHYMNIQSMRFEERLSFYFEIDDRCLNAFVPKLSIQPLVENAVIHVLEQSMAECTIQVRAEERNDSIFISVIDNGPGVPINLMEAIQRGEVTPKGTGIGLANIDERIQLLFGPEYGIRIGKRVEGAEIKIILPMRRLEDEVNV